MWQKWFAVLTNLSRIQIISILQKFSKIHGFLWIFIGPDLWFQHIRFGATKTEPTLASDSKNHTQWANWRVPLFWSCFRVVIPIFMILCFSRKLRALCVQEIHKNFMICIFLQSYLFWVQINIAGLTDFLRGSNNLYSSKILPNPWFSKIFHRSGPTISAYQFLDH